MSQSESPLFGTEYDRELESWLRRRFRYLCITYLVLGACDLVGTLLISGLGASWSERMPIGLFVVSRLGLFGIVLYYFRPANLRNASRTDLLRDVTLMILLLGLLSIATQTAVQWIDTAVSITFLLPLFFWHFSACLFLPWTPRESLKPVLPLLGLWAIGVLVLQVPNDPVPAVMKIVFAPGVLVPGLMISSWRLSRHQQRFRNSMIGRYFSNMRQEVARARTIHESMFPDPFDDGRVRLDYTYSPMRELGGDFLHCRSDPHGGVYMTLIDVTGHGLAAALTVNRLYGELERIYAESGDEIAPGEVLALLNRYIHLTLARHTVFATAACVHLDPQRGVLRWGNAGHPPVFVRGANGVVTALESSTMMLGAVASDLFPSVTERLELTPGDVVVLYTDGATEARNRSDEQFGIERFRELLTRRPAPRHWPQFLSYMVRKHTAKGNEDDVLIASLTLERQAALTPEPDGQLVATASADDPADRFTE